MPAKFAVIPNSESAEHIALKMLMAIVSTGGVRDLFVSEDMLAAAGRKITIQPFGSGWRVAISE